MPYHVAGNSVSLKWKNEEIQNRTENGEFCPVALSQSPDGSLESLFMPVWFLWVEGEVCKVEWAHGEMGRLTVLLSVLTRAVKEIWEFPT